MPDDTFFSGDLAEKLRVQAEVGVAQYAEAKTELDELRVTSQSPDRLVSVTVRCGGGVESIHG